MAKQVVVTIGRQFGSAGREIGRIVAKHLDVKLYDKEMLSRAAQESGLCKELFETHDEKPTNSFLYSLVMDTYSFGYSSAGFTDVSFTEILNLIFPCASDNAVLSRVPANSFLICKVNSSLDTSGSS